MAEQQSEPPVTDQQDEMAGQDAAILPKIIRFSELTRCGDEIWIEHERQIYRLRKTRQGKLILTK